LKRKKKKKHVIRTHSRTRVEILKREVECAKVSIPLTAKMPWKRKRLLRKTMCWKRHGMEVLLRRGQGEVKYNEAPENRTKKKGEFLKKET